MPRATTTKKQPLKKHQARRLDAWLKALRSGDYQQGDGYLCRGSSSSPKYCCLGVLCDVAGVSLTPKEFSETSSAKAIQDKIRARVPKSVATSDCNYSIINDSVLEYWTGLATPSGFCSAESLPEILADANDSGVSFKELARRIERRADVADPQWRDKI